MRKNLNDEKMKIKSVDVTTRDVRSEYKREMNDDLENHHSFDISSKLDKILLREMRKSNRKSIIDKLFKS